MTRYQGNLLAVLMLCVVVGVYSEHTIDYSLRNIDLSAISTLVSLEDILAADADTLQNIRLLRLSIVLYNVEFEDDVFVNLELPSYYGSLSCSATEAPVLSYCSVGDDIANCYDASIGLADVETAKLIRVVVENYDTCGAVVVTTSAAALAVVDPWNSEIIYDSGYDSSYTSGGIFSMCCEDIRAASPGWNGTLDLTFVDPLSSSGFTFQVQNTEHTRIPWEYTYKLLNPEISCDGKEISWEPVTVALDTLDEETTTLLNYPPYFDSFALSRVSDNYPYTNNMINFGLVQSGSETYTTNLLTTTYWRDFNYPKCIFNFQNVVYSNGDVVEQTIIPSIIDYSDSCNFTRFQEIGEYAQSVIDTEEIQTDRNSSITVELTSLMESAEYLACRHYIENSLTKSSVLKRSDTNCSIGLFFNPDFFGEYCCRGTGEHPGQFCEIRSYDENILVPDETKITDSLFGEPLCAQNNVQDYLNVLQRNTTVDPCDTLFFEQLNSFQGDILQECELAVYSESCISSEKCVEKIGRKSLCYYGRCEVFCSTDDDCWPGTCNSTTNFCATYGNGYPQSTTRSSDLYGTAHKTEIGEELVMKCIIDSLSTGNLIGDFIDLVNELVSDEIDMRQDVEAGFKDYFMTEVCVGQYWLATEFIEAGTVSLTYENQLVNIQRDFTRPKPTTQSACEAPTCNFFPEHEVPSNFDWDDCSPASLEDGFCGSQFYPFMEGAYGDITTNLFCFEEGVNETTCSGTWIENYQIYPLSNLTESICIVNDTTFCNYIYPGLYFGRCFAPEDTCSSPIPGYGIGQSSLCVSASSEVECGSIGGTYLNNLHIVSSSGQESTCPNPIGPGYCFGRPLKSPQYYQQNCGSVCVGVDTFRILSSSISNQDCSSTLGECFSFLTSIFFDKTESAIEDLTGVCTKQLNWESMERITSSDCGSDDWYLNPSRQYCVSYSLSIAGEASCNASDYTWVLIPTTSQDCITRDSACHQTINGIDTILMLTSSECENTQCVDCEMKGSYTWTNAYYAYGLFSKSATWQDRSSGSVNEWIPIIDNDKFDNIMAATIFTGLNRKQRSNLACSFNRLHTYAESIMCDLSDNDCQTSPEDFIIPPVSYLEFCSFSSRLEEREVSFLNGYFVYSNETQFTNAEGVNLPCARVVISEISSLELGGFDTIPLQTVDLVPRIQRLRNQPVIISNQNLVVMGQVVGDVFLFEITDDMSGGLQICFGPENYLDYLLNPAINTVDFYGDLTQTVSISFYEEGQTFNRLEWTILEATRYTDGTICGTIDEDITQPFLFGASYTFYNAEKNPTPKVGWARRAYFDNMGVFDRIFDMVMVMLYIVSLLLCTINFYLHIKFHDRRNRVFWTLPKIGLLFLMSFQVLRIVYHVIILFPFLQSTPLLVFVFSEFAALIYYSVCSITVLRWAEIYHFAMSSKGFLDKVLPLYIGINAALLACFLVVFVIYAFLQPNANTIITCTGPERSPEAITLTGVAIFYKIYFTIICVGLVAAFILYTIGLRSRLTGSQTAVSKKQNRNDRKLQKLVIVSAITVVSLVAQVINLITTIFWNTRELWTSLIFAFITELIPMFIFLYMFRRKSQFSKQGNVTAATATNTNTR